MTDQPARGAERPLRVVQYGLGPIGLETARTVLAKSRTGRIALVGALDIHPEKVGRDLAELLELDRATGVVVSGDPRRTLSEARPHVALHTTSSFLPDVYDQLLLCAEAGVHVVSSTEELFFPFQRHPELAERLDRAARANGVVLVGTGVNPGYVMDTLALTATGICSDVRSVRIARIVDAAQRRLPLQRKIGAGLTPQAFQERKASGTFGHIGLRESLLFLADGLGWELERFEEHLHPVVAEAEVRTPFLLVHAGEVAGIHHQAAGYAGGRVVLSLELKMYVGADDPQDAIHVEGTPPIDLVLPGGIFGDTATVAALVNTAPLVMDAPPGLRTTKELPIPRAFATTAPAVADLS